MLAVRRRVVLLMRWLLVLRRVGRRVLHVGRRGTTVVVLLVGRGLGRASRRALLVVRVLVHGDREHLRRHLHGGGGGGRLDALAHEQRQASGKASARPP